MDTTAPKRGEPWSKTVNRKEVHWCKHCKFWTSNSKHTNKTCYKNPSNDKNKTSNTQINYATYDYENFRPMFNLEHDLFRLPPENLGYFSDEEDSEDEFTIPSLVPRLNQDFDDDSSSDESSSVNLNKNENPNQNLEEISINYELHSDLEEDNSYFSESDSDLEATLPSLIKRNSSNINLQDSTLVPTKQTSFEASKATSHSNQSIKNLTNEADDVWKAIQTFENKAENGLMQLNELFQEESNTITVDISFTSNFDHEDDEQISPFKEFLQATSVEDTIFYDAEETLSAEDISKNKHEIIDPNPNPSAKNDVASPETTPKASTYFSTNSPMLVSSKTYENFESIRDLIFVHTSAV